MSVTALPPASVPGTAPAGANGSTATSADAALFGLLVDLHLGAEAPGALPGATLDPAAATALPGGTAAPTTPAVLPEGQKGEAPSEDVAAQADPSGAALAAGPSTAALALVAGAAVPSTLLLPVVVTGQVPAPADAPAATTEGEPTLLGAAPTDLVATAVEPGHKGLHAGSDPAAAGAGQVSADQASAQVTTPAPDQAADQGAVPATAPAPAPATATAPTLVVNGIAPTALVTPGDAVVATASGPVSHEALLEQVLPSVPRLVTRGDGTSKLSLKLHPADLGEVHVTVTVKDKVVDVTLAAGAQARDALAQSSDRLRTLLEGIGHTAGQVTLRDLANAATTSTTPGTLPQPGTHTGQQPGHQPGGAAGQQPDARGDGRGQAGHAGHGDRGSGPAGAGSLGSHRGHPGGAPGVTPTGLDVTV